MPDRADTLRRLLSVGRRLVEELDQEAVLGQVLEAAREATGARYGAIGVLNEDRTELERFLHSGLSDEEARAIGPLPRGRGVLGVLIERPEPLRLDDVGRHEKSFGFPLAHPPMHTFLGVPILIRGEAWGNLYLAAKADDAPFTDGDQETVTILAEFAATAIDNARIHGRSERRRLELERAVRGLDAARNIADAIGAEPELSRVLELIAKRGRALVEARCVLILLRDGDELVVSTVAGQIDASGLGRRVSLAGSTSGDVLARGESVRVRDAQHNLRISPEYVGVTGAQNALLVPMIYRREALGTLLAFDRGPDREPFSVADANLLETFAASAANAVAISHSVEADRLRSAIAAAEAERRRWARELHDETLQSLGALRILLSGSLRRDDPDVVRGMVGQAIGDIELEIANLRAIITELRPLLLDDLGLGPAIDALVDRRREDGLTIRTDVTLPGMSLEEDEHELPPELETTVYRLIQESLTNIVKHAKASQVDVTVHATADAVTVTIRDDGIGFDPSERVAGFGLSGIRERVYLAQGSLSIESTPGAGTTVVASLPRGGRGAPAAAAAAPTGDSGERGRDEAVAAGGLPHGLD